MDYPSLIAAAIAGIFFIIFLLRQLIPALAGDKSVYCSVIALVLGIGVAIYASIHYEGLNAFEIILTAIIPALSASGVHSTVNSVSGN
jgi:hypothetical protein